MRAKLTLLAGVCAGAIAFPAYAQDAEDAQDLRTSGNEIVVTAQRTTQRLQDVPVAVSAFSTDNLEKQQISNPLELQLALPNTTLTYGNFSATNITIRGIGSPVVAASGDAGVAIHFNDMPLISSRLFDSEFYDLERIEVLRGPQGTLFGRNATAGVFNVITAKPDLTGFKAAGEASYGNYNAIQVQGMVNVPVAETLGVRLAGIYLKRDGYTKNLNTGNQIDGRDYYSVRGSLKFEPTDTTRLTVTGQYFQEDSNRSRGQKQLCAKDPTGILGCRPDREGFDAINGDATATGVLASREFLAIAFGGLGLGGLSKFALGSVYADDGDNYTGAIVPTDVRTVAVDFEPLWNSDQTTVQAELQQDIGNVTLTLNGGYSHSKYSSSIDYNLTTTRSILDNPGLVALRQAAAGQGVFTPTERLFATRMLASNTFRPGSNQICTSAYDPLHAGSIAGRVQGCTDNSNEFDYSAGESTQWSLEGRVATDFDGPFNFLLGGLYLQNKGKNITYSVMASGFDYMSAFLGILNSGFGNSTMGPPFFDSETAKAELTTYGVFGEVYFNIADNLKLTGGLRYSNDKKYIAARQPFLLLPVANGTSNVNALIDQLDNDKSKPGQQTYAEQEGTFDAVTGRVVLDWKPEVSFTQDTLVYASYTRGNKPGGFNPPYDPNLFPPVPTTFKGETIDAFEVGTKNTFLGGELQLNLTGFYYKYKDFQVSRIINRTSFNDNTDANIWGAELEAIIRPSRNFTVNASMSYLNTKILNFSAIDTRNPSNGRSDVAIIKDLQSGANCVVAPTVAGSVPIATTLALVNGFNAAAGGGLIRPAVQVPGTNSYGAYSLCGALGDFLRASTPVGTYMYDTGAGGGQFLPGGVARDISGNELANSPKWKFAIGAQYDADIGGDWTLTPRVDLSVTGTSWGSNFNTIRDKLAGYEIVNAQLILTGPESKISARAFISNVFNSQAITGKYITDPSSALFTNIYTLDPRTYGVAVGFKF
ncbi:TonB-dependent receptor-like protein [Novosphingobium kunmingense]|uniref:TonB-dependent receptor-like protein n=1 Tax=Novosphingobium kunmingense TaxID=1211806 RepID=A0A2N0H6B2_9SPHN|nr:TonB-dependent receptor [Novosphingobium kunmingense]PKB14446.1 TonB-dependent receptor-like protein [Novosphingobium kunmingense]